MTQQEKVTRFRELHLAPDILVLPNAWDIASARIFEMAGFPAVGTTSAGIAASLGYPDGQAISRDEMLDMVARIVRAVSVPVTADIESGYGSPVETVKAVSAIGTVGINLEDSVAGQSSQLVDIATQQSIVRTISSLGLPLFINVRTDIFLAEIGDPETRTAQAIERLNAYREAGADCLFAPGVTDASVISTLTRQVRGPINILATLGTPPVRVLQDLGVARVSIGSGAARATFGLVRRIAHELRNFGTYENMLQGQIPYPEVNEMLKHPKSD